MYFPNYELIVSGESISMFYAATPAKAKEVAQHYTKASGNKATVRKIKLKFK